VIARRALDEREIHAGSAGVEELAEVGVVGQEPVGLDQRGVAVRVWCGGRELLDQPGVARRGLEHQRRPAHPTRLPVQDDDGPGAQRCGVSQAAPLW
jgi:hypothetical protein